MARVDRLDQHIADLQEKIEIAKSHPAVQKMMHLQKKLDEARRVNDELLASEEDVPTITGPRKPRARKQAKMPEMNGVSIGKIDEPAQVEASE
jgi:hypothetical protein